MLRHTFKAMGTSCEVLLDASPTPAAEQALRQAEFSVRKWESMCTRFDPSSELMRLNQARSGIASEPLYLLLRFAWTAHRRTFGAYNPLLGRRMVELGYDRTFARLSSARGIAPTLARKLGEQLGELRLDDSSRRVEIVGAGDIDLGAVAKGWCADRVSDELSRVGPCLINIGGDLAATPGAQEQWSIAVEGVSRDAIFIPWGGVATSGTEKRRWFDSRSGHDMHHVLDPQTQDPLRGPFTRVTCVAGTAAQAEVAATSLLLAPSPSELQSRADRLDVQYLAVAQDGALHRSEELVA